MVTKSDRIAWERAARQYFCTECPEKGYQSLYEEQKARADELDLKLTTRTQDLRLCKRNWHIENERAEKAEAIIKDANLHDIDELQAKLEKIADELKRIAINYNGDELVDKLEELAKGLRTSDKDVSKELRE